MVEEDPYQQIVERLYDLSRDELRYLALECLEISDGVDSPMRIRPKTLQESVRAFSRELQKFVEFAAEEWRINQFFDWLEARLTTRSK